MMVKFFADFISGWIAGCSALIIGHPFDTVKTRLQTMSCYLGPLDCFSSTIRNERIRGLYKGLVAPFMASGLLHSLYFSGYGLALRIAHPEDVTTDGRKNVPLPKVLFASTAGAVAQLAPAIPIELIKTKLQVPQGAAKNSLGSNTFKISTMKERTVYRGSLHCARTIYLTGGFKALYRGGSIMAFRDVFGYLFYMPVYEYTRGQLKHRKFNDAFSGAFAGGLAGSVSWWVVCPIELIKNRVQICEKNEPSSLLKTAQMIRNKEGLKGFYRGGFVLVLRAFLTNALLFFSYQHSLDFIENLSQHLVKSDSQ